MSPCRKILVTLCLAFLSFSLTACDSPQEKEAKYINRGNVLFEQGMYTKARLEYKNAARINPTSAEVRYRLALVDEAEGNLRNAFLGFTKAEQQSPRYVPVLLKLVQYYLAAEQYNEAQTRLDIITADAPNDAQGHALRGALLLRQKKFEEAKKESNLALDKEPANVTAFSVLTGIYVAEKNPAKAAATVEEGIARNPKDLSLLLLKAMVHEPLGNLEKISEAYRDIFRLKPTEVRFRADLADIYLKANKKPEAENILRSGVAELPNSEDMQRRLINFLDDSQGIEVAEKEIRSMMQADPANAKLNFWLADLYIKHKDAGRAISLLEKLVAEEKSESETSSLNARTSLAKIYSIQGNKETAEKLVAIVLEKDPNNPDALFIRARLSYEQGFYQSAVSDLRTLLRDTPNAKSALQLLAEALLTQGHLELAIDTINQLLTVDPTNINARVRLAQVYGLHGEVKRAMEILEIVNKTHPELAVGWESMARVAIGAKEWDKAKGAINKLELLDGQRPTALFLKGQVSFFNSKPEEALPLFKEVILINPHAPLAEHALGGLVSAAQAANKMQEAVTFIEGLKEPSAYIVTILGESYTKLGRLDEAAAQLDKAIAMAPTFQEPYLQRANLSMIQRKPDEAIALLLKAKQSVPADLRAAMAAADIYGGIEKYDEAIALYEEILARNPKADIAANNMAQLIADNPNANDVLLEKARIAAERFISSTNPLLLDTLGWVYFKQGQTAQAQTIMERVMSFGDKLPAQIVYHYGAILLKQSRTDEAKALLEKATAAGVQPYPGIDEARKLLKEANK